MHRLEDRRFERLTALTCVGKTNGGHRLWKCLCECGTECVVAAYELISKHSRSCGCLQREAASVNGKRSRTHGKADSYIYHVWNGLKGRCYRESDPGYPNYGGRGIKVCERWLNSFENFYADMGDKPSPQHSLDRIDVNGNYEPSNCRWATQKEQANNKRNNVFLTLGNKTLTIAQWSRELEMHQATLEWRLRKGWPVTKALTQEVKKRP